MSQPKSIGIVGAGIAGLTCAYLLSSEHRVTVFEADARVGGHSNTVTFPLGDREYSIDTGFIVFNDRTYPLFRRLLSQLGLSGNPTRMSFSVRCDQSGLEYCGSNLNGLFAQRRNLLKPEFLRMVYDILRFNSVGTRDADVVSDDETVGAYLDRNGLSAQFADHYLLPMGAAIWSCPTGRFRDFPIRFILQFYRNHGLMQIRDRPQWFTLPGGSGTYVERLIRPFRDRIQTNSPVRCVRRYEDRVEVTGPAGVQQFDEIIFACHSDQALGMLADASAEEQEMLRAFPYEANDVVLHWDDSVMPTRKRAWAAWNYRLSAETRIRPTVSYWMNLLQHVESQYSFFVTLNDGSVRQDRIISSHRYHHPVFTLERARMQSRHHQFIRSHRTSFCGAWWGNGFHEDGVASAVRVCDRFGKHALQSPLSESPAPAIRLASSRDAEEARIVGTRITETPAGRPLVE